MRDELHRRAPDLAWLWSPPADSTGDGGHLTSIAGLCRHLRLAILLIEDDSHDAAVVGLLHTRGPELIT